MGVKFEYEVNADIRVNNYWITLQWCHFANTSLNVIDEVYEGIWINVQGNKLMMLYEIRYDVHWSLTILFKV